MHDHIEVEHNNMRTNGSNVDTTTSTTQHADGMSWVKVQFGLLSKHGALVVTTLPVLTRLFFGELVTLSAHTEVTIWRAPSSKSEHANLKLVTFLSDEPRAASQSVVDRYQIDVYCNGRVQRQAPKVTVVNRKSERYVDLCGPAGHYDYPRRSRLSDYDFAEV